MYIQLDGQILYYEKTGQGRPLILLHGNSESHKIYDELVSVLEDDYEIYAIDTRGHGLSATPSEYHYSDMADDLLNFIKSLAIKNPCVVGFSDGGITAILAAMQSNDALGSMIVCGANLTTKAFTFSGKQIIKKMCRKDKTARTKIMLKEPNIKTDELKKISIPTLVLAGENDMIKKSETELIANSISDSTLNILPNEDHISYVVHTDKLAPIIREFYPCS